MLYSIIIPHKNNPELLNRLLISIPCRDDLEIIVVDDNSDPSIVDFSNIPGLNRNNIKVIYNSGSFGAGSARNKGMSVATGSWLIFADADDYFSPYFNEFLDKYSTDFSTELVLLNACGVNSLGKTVGLKLNRYFNNYKKGRFYSEKVIRYNMWTPWTRMVRKDFVNKNKIRFESVSVGNDLLFGLECSKLAVNIKVETEIVYCYLLPWGRSITEQHKKDILNLDGEIALRFMQKGIYDEVGYVFKPVHLIDICKSTVDSVSRIEYLKRYFSILRKYKYPFILDLWYFIIHMGGRIFGII